MTSFEFRQESLLRLRRQQKRLAEMKLMKADMHIQQAKNEVKRIQDQMEELVVQSSARDSQQIVSWFQASQSLQHAAQVAQKNVEAKQVERRAILDEFNQAARDLEAMEALRVRDWHEYQKQRKRREAAVLDDVAMKQWFQVRG